MSGQITDVRNGLPVADAQVAIGTAGVFMNFTALQGTLSASDGSYSFEVPGNASYFVRVIAPPPYLQTFWPSKPCRQGDICDVTGFGNIFAAAGQVTIADVAVSPPGSISGVVVGDADGQPIAAAQLVAEWVSQPGQPLYLMTATEFTDGSGLYVMDGMPPGVYRIRVTAGVDYIDELYDDIVCLSSCVGGGIGETEISVLPDVDRGSTDFGLAAAASITGMLSETGGAAPSPDTRVLVTAFRDSGGALEQIRQELLPGGQAEFELAALPAGSYRVATRGCLDGGCATYASEVYSDRVCATAECSAAEILLGDPINLAAGETVDIMMELEPAASISGCVRDAVTLQGLSNITVKAYAYRSFPFTSVRSLGSAVTGVNGCYFIDYLPSDSIDPVHVRTANAAGYDDRIYFDVPCLGGDCMLGAGVPIALAHNENVSGLDFSLPVGQSIAGRIRVTEFGPAAEGAALVLTDGQGSGIRGVDADVLISDSNGGFQTFGLIDGTYFIAADYQGERFIYGLPGPQPLQTPIQSGQPIIVDGGSVRDLDFVLNPDALLRDGFE